MDEGGRGAEGGGRGVEEAPDRLDVCTLVHLGCGSLRCASKGEFQAMKSSAIDPVRIPTSSVTCARWSPSRKV